MGKVTQTSARKSDHLRINLEENVLSNLTTGLERYRFIHRALPELDLDQIDLSQTLFGRKLNYPILISSMTGGSEEASSVNHILASAAQMTGIAMGLGSMRVALEKPEFIPTFQVRRVAPDILLFANLGAVQLNYGYGLDHCQRVVDMVEADALILHFNALQEALQFEGNTHFSNLLVKVEEICKKLPVPVIAKEVGWGFSAQDIRDLVQAGISAIDVAGAGGTSWSQVEMHRAQTHMQTQIAADFINWGIPTVEAIQIAYQNAPNVVIFASGGLRSGIDIAKCIALGATLGGIAGPFLKTAIVSVEKTVEAIQLVSRELQICMFAVGVGNLNQLKTTSLIRI